MEPGVYRTADPAQLQRTKAEYESKIASTHERAQQWNGHKEDYECLKTRFGTSRRQNDAPDHDSSHEKGVHGRRTRSHERDTRPSGR